MKVKRRVRKIFKFTDRTYEIKVCPFCGKLPSAEISQTSRRINGMTSFLILCENESCGVRPAVRVHWGNERTDDFFYPLVENAVKRWNKRETK